uniref:Uncharacterized protein n=1 Tax=Tetraselmis sp. GSL018 TaxID=582737 RepID=A0A061QW91_9CHLO
MASKWPGAEILVVMPSRLEAGASCFDHFLTSTSLTGEPLEYARRAGTKGHWAAVEPDRRRWPAW